jgi:hypothetical protein
MPYRIPGIAGTFYRPGERKGAGIVWRGKGPDGLWHEIGTGESHNAGAKRRVDAFLAKLESHRTPAAGEQVTLAIAAAHYRAGRNLEDAHPDARRIDEIVAHDGDLICAEINQATVNAAVRRRRDARRAEAGRAPSADTLTRDVVTPYRSIMRFAYRQGWAPLREFESVRPMPGDVPRHPPAIARDGDVAKMLTACEAEIVRADARPYARRHKLHARAFRALLWLTHERGFRIAEWLRLDWEWLDLAAARGRILIGKPLRWKEFDLSAEAVAALAELDPRSAGKVFPWQTRGAVYGWADRLGAPLGIKWRPHDSRRAVITDLIRKTGDVKLAADYVGQASTKSTLRYRIVDAGESTVEIRLRGRLGKAV